MKKINFSELKNYYNEVVELHGFVEKVRDLQYVQFLILRDKSGSVQVTLEKDGSLEELNKIVTSLKVESTVKVTGKVLENEKVKLGGLEVIPSMIEITSEPVEELPINYKDLNGTNLDTRMDYRFLDLRNEKNSLMFKVQSCLVEAMRDFLYKNNFSEIHTPKLIGAASESGSDVFEVKYFKGKAYLAQSPQFINKWRWLLVWKEYLK